MSIEQSQLSPSPCKNCQTLLQGGFCHACGQKDITDHDRRLRHLVELFISETFSLDGKFWRSLRGLAKPGFLAREYLTGRRAPYLSPVSVFLLANVLYFLFPVLSDFDLPFSDHIPGHMVVQLQDFNNASAERTARIARGGGQLHSAWTAGWVEARVRARQAADPAYSLDALSEAFDEKSGDISKLLIFLHAPFLALALMLMFWKKNLYFAEHFVVALSIFATVLIAVQLLFPLLGWISLPKSAATPVRLILNLVFVGLIANALQRVYQTSLWYSALASLGFFAALLIVNVSVYRSVQFMLIFVLI